MVRDNWGYLPSGYSVDENVDIIYYTVYNTSVGVTYSWEFKDYCHSLPFPDLENYMLREMKERRI